MVDQDDLAGAEQPLADGQRADHIVGGDPARVADHVRFALVQAEHPVHIQPRIHAGHYGNVAGRRHRQRAAECLRVTGVVGQVVIGDAHAGPFAWS